ncbi:unnamed protein product, partial [Ectocarpus sp. 12 AP-2014]
GCRPEAEVQAVWFLRRVFFFFVWSDFRSVQNRPENGKSGENNGGGGARDAPRRGLLCKRREGRESYSPRHFSYNPPRRVLVAEGTGGGTGAPFLVHANTSQGHMQGA